MSTSSFHNGLPFHIDATHTVSSPAHIHTHSLSLFLSSIMHKTSAIFAAISLSLSLSLVSAHPHGHGALEKRATATCSKTYTPVAAGQYPAIDCVPFTQDPQVVEWLKLVDFTKTPVFPTSVDGACPTDITTLPQDRCWWTCQKCEASDDINSCPTAGSWGLTYDGKEVAGLGSSCPCSCSTVQFSGKNVLK